MYILGALALIPTIDVINCLMHNVSFLKLNGFEVEGLLYVLGVFKVHK